MGKKLRTGLVATIRVNPQDAQSVLHVLEKAGIKRGMNSFSVCVSDALGILLESSRQGGIIPEPDPYNFINELSDFVGDGAPDRRRKSKPAIGVGQELHQRVQEVITQAAPTAPYVDPAIPTDPEKLIEYKEAIKRLTSAQQKKDLVDQGTPDVYWSDSDEADFQRDVKIVYGA